MLSDQEKEYQDRLHRQRKLSGQLEYADEDDEDEASLEADEPRGPRHHVYKLIFFVGIVVMAVLFLKGINGQVGGDWSKLNSLWNNVTTEVDKYKQEANSDWQQGEDLVEQAKQKKAEVEALKKTLTDLTNGGVTTVVNETETTVDNNSLPVWIKSMKDDSTVADYLIPNFRCNYSGSIVYLGLGGQPDCADCFTDIVYKNDGDLLCSASGGIAGFGDGQCQDFYKKINDCYIWNEERWEVTKVGE